MVVLPRSDKFYVGLIIAFSAVVIVLSIVAAISAFSGDSDKRPAYESAPAPSLVQLPPDTLVSNIGGTGMQQETEGAPMSDETFLLLHSTTRKMLDAITQDSPSIAASKLKALGLSSAESYELTRKYQQEKRYLPSNLMMVPDGKQNILVQPLRLAVNSPEYAGQSVVQSETSADQGFVMVDKTSARCHRSDSFPVTLTLKWTLPLDVEGNPIGKWRAQPSLAVDTPQPTDGTGSC